MTVADRIKIAREVKGLSQDELAKRMGYASKSAVSRTENSGDNIGQKRIKEFASALNVPISYIMGWEDFEYDYKSQLWIKKEVEMPTFQPEHLELISLYSKLNEEQKKTVMTLLKTLAPQD